ncbi:MAG: hypothetical protein KTR30_09125 [Saprospiraceae bacterium]|nr:hypothetical protein [Saprospiraceae bacterium]
MQKPSLSNGCFSKFLLLLFVWGALPATFAAYSSRKEFTEQLKWITYYDQISSYDFRVAEATLRTKYRSGTYYLIKGEVMGHFSTSLSMNKSAGEEIFGPLPYSSKNNPEVFYPRQGRSILTVYAIPAQKLAKLPNRFDAIATRRQMFLGLLPQILLIFLPMIYAWYYLIRILSTQIFR